MIRSYSRGHEIVFWHNAWVWADTLQPIKNNDRPCKRCARMPTPEGYDACLGYMPGVVSACCGHGVELPFMRQA